jgi:hypothetical protein
MLADLIILAFVVAFVSVATLGHVMLGAALLAGRAVKPVADQSDPGHRSMTAPAGAANDPQPTAGELAA